MKKGLCLLLCLLLPLTVLAGDVQITLQATKSDILPENAVAALNTLLSGAELTLSFSEDTAGYTLTRRTEMLLSDTVSESDAGERLLTFGENMGNLLADCEKEARKSLKIGSLTSSFQKTYVLTSAQWAEKEADVLTLLQNILPETDFSAWQILGDKATFKRYFDKAGQEIGGYFYAGKMQIGENDTREIRAEWGKNESSVYLALRSPDKSGKNNLKIAFQSQKTAKNITFSLDLSYLRDENKDVVKAEGKLPASSVSGKITASYTRTRGDGSVKYALTAKQTGDTAWNYEITRSGKKYLAGTVEITPCDGKIPAEAAGSPESLALYLAKTISAECGEDAPILLHYLCTSAYLTGDVTDISYDIASEEEKIQ